MAEPIAIVGSACRFPGSATSPSRLWDLLREPRDVLSEFPPERLNLTGVKKHDGKGPYRSYLLDEDFRRFDAAFFKIHNKEAEATDPQQRMLLEIAFEAIEAAGWPLDAVNGSSTSVHVGVMTSDYNDIQMRDPDTLPTYAATGLARSMLANRISYFFNLNGPSVTIDTACSSSLVAVHQAVQGLRSGDAVQAIVAGSALLLDSAMYIAETRLHMLSPDSRSRIRDKDANGYARGEGCAAIVLKPLSRAIADNDHIDCLIRETGVNSDGRTSGITFPSPIAQADLIRQTYRKAGLDPVRDRCQYFECHGTGTPAGDPIEARAIQEAFFSDDLKEPEEIPLYCGSIKTVIGHLEGCAGLAGVLKATLLSKSPGSDLAGPLAGNFKRNTARCVNSFGFGGTNAHVILESFQASRRNASSEETRFPIDSLMFDKIAGPFVFSANSSAALLGYLQRLSDHIRLTPSLDLDALEYTLSSRRTAFSIRTWIAAPNRARLLDLLEKKIHGAEATRDNQYMVQTSPTDSHSSPGVLGVFTGQGAQWTKMGHELMVHCPRFNQSIQICHKALSSLSDALEWSLIDELVNKATEPWNFKPELSQPLCTALQIALVDLLRAAGIHFDVVIGHSSGEIAAGYAAGVLSIRDAMCIAYYRGSVAHMAKGHARENGAMMAVGMGFEHAIALCSKPSFLDRITVAAINSPSNVTLSGDTDAIQEAKRVLNQQDVFARVLNVDVAYHSHHMAACAEKYRSLLNLVKIQPQAPKRRCKWYSTVYEGVDLLQGPLSKLADQYWVDNLTHPVLFSHALRLAIGQNPTFHGILEVGPHPALKTAVRETIDVLSRPQIPYSGCLSRGNDDVESISAAIGFLWTINPHSIDFEGWRKAFGRPHQRQMVKSLPPYAWDHDRVYWHESRISSHYRLNADRPHELLGRLEEDRKSELTWRNVFCQNDLPWMKGHTFQNQVVFPAAAYVSMVIDAAQRFLRNTVVDKIEIRDMVIPKALVIPEGDDGVEIAFRIMAKSPSANTNYRGCIDTEKLETQFSCYSGSSGHDLVKTCEGQLTIYVSPTVGAFFPRDDLSEHDLPPLGVDKFFKMLETTGIRYEGVFRALDSINRIWGVSRASATWTKQELYDDHTLHPAILDVGFQTGFATFASLAEETNGIAYLPSRIGRIVMSPSQKWGSTTDVSIDIHTHLVKSTHAERELDIVMFNADARHEQESPIQIDGLVLSAVTEPSPSNDRNIFAKTVWEVDVATEFLTSPPANRFEDEWEYIEAVERTAVFFMQNIRQSIPEEMVDGLQKHHRLLLRGIDALLGPISSGQHNVVESIWMDDTRETMKELSNRFPGSIDIALLTAVGENLPSVMRGESQMLEHMLKDDMLSRLYSEGRGFSACNDFAAHYMRQITHKYPRTRILEIGAGTGGTTKSVLDAIRGKFASYTFTDISSGFFEKATERLAAHSQHMEFKTLNIETSPVNQGFSEGAYDIVIAANVLHATCSLSETIRNARSLLRPGGYLVAIEVTGTMLREPGLMGGLEGWWRGFDEGRFPSPGVSESGWDRLLATDGFTGIEAISYDFPDISRHNCSVFVTQAMTEQFSLLRDPLSSMNLALESPILILGGTTLPVIKAVRQVDRLLRRWTMHISTCSAIDLLDPSKVAPGTNVVCLQELDNPIFSASLNETTLQILQELLGKAASILWVTAGCRDHDPRSNMMIGVGRALAFELPHLDMQFLDFDPTSAWNMEMVVQHLLRMVILSSPNSRNHDLLWAQEPEIQVRKNTPFIPRLITDEAAKESLNATRRQITRLITPKDTVEVSRGDGKVRLALVNSKRVVPSEDAREVKVLLSVPLHNESEEPCFLCFGSLSDNQQSAFALSRIETSVVTVKKDNVFETTPLRSSPAEVLFSLGSMLVASWILHNSPGKGTTLVHDAPTSVADALLAEATASGREVIFSTSTVQDAQPAWIHIHPFAPTRTIRRLIPKDASVLWRLSDVSIDNIVPCLAKSCAIRRFEAGSLSQLGAMLAEAYQMTAEVGLKSMPTVVGIEEFASHKSKNGRLSMVLEFPWKENTILPTL